MPDNHFTEIRSFGMSRIRAVNNSCEEIVRKYLFLVGYNTGKMISVTLENRILFCQNIGLWFL
jgi:G:T-mismatch repair DNA endonuclease (very short patch repair protein)